MDLYIQIKGATVSDKKGEKKRIKICNRMGLTRVAKMECSYPLWPSTTRRRDPFPVVSPSPPAPRSPRTCRSCLCRPRGRSSALSEAEDLIQRGHPWGRTSSLMAIRSLQLIFWNHLCSMTSLEPFFIQPILCVLSTVNNFFTRSLNFVFAASRRGPLTWPRG